MKLALFLLFLGAFAFRSEAALNTPDSQAHMMVGFQSVFLLERYFHQQKMAKEDAMLLANGIAFTLALAKEKLVDPTFSTSDMGLGFIGAAFASTLFYLLPEKSFELEAEGGYFHYSPKSGPTNPPSSNMVKAQSTIWFGDYLGVHQFSGGADNGADDDSGKRLQYGAGLRFPFLPLLKRKQRLLSTWVGVDYGRLLFATASRNVPYIKHTTTLFYSAGMRLHLGKKWQLNFEGQHIPYKGAKINAVGASLGLTL